MRTATKIKAMNERQTVYRLSPPFECLDEERYEYVLASKANTWTGEATSHGSFAQAGPTELLVFPCDASGSRLSGVELGGSYNCPGGDAEALGLMGYRLQLKVAGWLRDWNGSAPPE